MADYFDKYGMMYQANGATPHEREQTYVIIKQARKVVCLRDEYTGIYYFPDQGYVEFNQNPTLSFIVTAHIYEAGKFVVEKQTYLVYDVVGADINSLPLEWCNIDDLLVAANKLDGRQKVGFKNFLVRVK